MTDRYIKHPLEVVSVGDIVEVKVVDVDVAKQRISLSMRLDDDGSGEKKTPGAGVPAKDKPVRRDDRPRRDNNDRQGRNGNRSGNSGAREEFAPGTIGYILAHQKKR